MTREEARDNFSRDGAPRVRMPRFRLKANGDPASIAVADSGSNHLGWSRPGRRRPCACLGRTWDPTRRSEKAAGTTGVNIASPRIGHRPLQ